MVFLFPGILFRRFYFSGSASKQFNQGNLLERFLWTLLLSIVCLIICGLIFYAIDNWIGLTLLHNDTHGKILNVFECLSQNEFPDTFKDDADLKDLGIIMLVVYSLSAAIGIFLIKVVRLFSLDTFIGILQFTDDWQYLKKPYKKHGLTKKLGDVHATFIDVLTVHKDKEELYKGILKDFITDKEHKLENIVISDAQKFIQIEKNEENRLKILSLTNLSDDKNSGYKLHTNFDDRVTFIKKISGDLLVLPNQNVLNINFTYVRVANVVEKVKKWIIQALFLTLYLAAIGLFIFTLLQIDSPYFNSVLKKATFSVFTFLIYFSFVGLLQFMIMRGTSEQKGIAGMSMFLFAVPYLWIFEFYSIWITIAVFIIIFAAITIALAKYGNSGKS